MEGRTSFFDPRELGGPCESAKTVSSWTEALASWREARRGHRPAKAHLAILVERTRGEVMLYEARAISGDGPTALVIGSHPYCDVVVDESASLRHALLLVWPDEQRAQIEVLDLRTSTGIGRGGRAVSGLSGRGALQFTLGRLRITVIALGAQTDGPSYSDELDRLLDDAEPEEVQGIDEGRRSLSRARTRVASEVDRQAIEEWSRLTPVRGLFASGRGFARFGSGGVLEVEATVDDWMNGVVIGRDARCTGHDKLRQWAISRVHAIFLARGGRRYVIDTGSTNGTTVIGRSTQREHAFLSFDHRVAELTNGLSVVVGDMHVVVKLRTTGDGLA